MSTQSIRSRLTTWGSAALMSGMLSPALAVANPLERRTPLLDTARAATVREAAAAKERRAQQAPATPAPELQSRSFFKSAAGIATLVIFGAGVGYALYSSSNDRIRSEGR
jgi:hypothetical protein